MYMYVYMLNEILKCTCQGYWYNAVKVFFFVFFNAVKVTEIICTNIYDDILLNKCHKF